MSKKYNSEDGNLEELVKEALENAREDRGKVVSALKPILEDINSGNDADLGKPVSNLLQDLQRSNEQIIKIMKEVRKSDDEGSSVSPGSFTLQDLDDSEKEEVEVQKENNEENNNNNNNNNS